MDEDTPYPRSPISGKMFLTEILEYQAKNRKTPEEIKDEIAIERMKDCIVKSRSFPISLPFIALDRARKVLPRVVENPDQYRVQFCEGVHCLQLVLAVPAQGDVVQMNAAMQADCM